MGARWWATDRVAVMTPEIQELFDAARAIQRRAYAPYSNYQVGAAVRTASGAVDAGCNVENAA